MDVNVCRLCFTLVKNHFEVIDEVKRQMLEVLLLKVDLNVSKNPILCQDCQEIIKKCYFLKRACTDTEELILSFSNANARTELDMKDVYVANKDVKTVTNENFNVCRLCMNQTDGSIFVSIDVLMKNIIYVDMLPVFLPNMVRNNMNNSVICISCKTLLDCYSKFAQKCLDTEEKINTYRRSEGTNSTNQITLSNVLGFLFKENNLIRDKAVIKQENIYEDVEQNVVIKMYDEQVKCESLDIKDDANFENICDDASKVEIYNCGICTYETEFTEDLNKHILTHENISDVEMYKCEICIFETKRKRYLKRHLLIHKDVSEVEVYKCGVCTFETKYKDSLKNHILTHKSASEVEMYKCEICTYETKYRFHLKRHMLVHKDTSQVHMHKCEICTFETKYKPSLKTHMRCHKDTSEVEISRKGDICTYKKRYNYLFKSIYLKRGNQNV